MHEQLRVGNSVRLIRDVGERLAGTSGTVVGYYVDSGLTVVTFADGTADVPRHMLKLAAEDASLGRDLPSRSDSGELVQPMSDVL